MKFFILRNVQADYGALRLHRVALTYISTPPYTFVAWVVHCGITSHSDGPIFFKLTQKTTQDSIAGVVTRLRAGQLGLTLGSIPCRCERFSVLQNIHIGFTDADRLIQWISGAHSLVGVNWPWREAGHSPPCSTDAKNVIPSKRAQRELYFCALLPEFRLTSEEWSV
jgi:hypothetical protein